MVKLLDKVQGNEELNVILSQDHEDNSSVLARLQLAIDFKEKKVINGSINRKNRLSEVSKYLVVIASYFLQKSILELIFFLPLLFTTFRLR